MGAIFAYLFAFGLMTLSVTGVIIRNIPRMLIYVPKTARGKFIYGGATATSVVLFNDDQLDALEHVFISPESTHDFNQVVREFMTTDIGLAKSASNYLTGDYGRTMMIHVGLTGITLLPLGMMAASGIRNAKAVTSNAGIMSQFGFSMKNVKFSDFIQFFTSKKPSWGQSNGLTGRIPISKRQKFIDDLHAYFKKMTTKGKPTGAKSNNSVHSKMSGLPQGTDTIGKIKNVALRKDVLAIESIMTLFVAMWLAINGDTDAILDEKRAEKDMSRLDNMINESYNFFHANSLLGGDIHALKSRMRIDNNTAKHTFITFMHIGIKLIDIWLALSELDRLKYHRILLLMYDSVVDVLEGRTTKTNINPTTINAALDAISSHSAADLVSVLALQRELDTVTKKAVFTGCDEVKTFKYLFLFMGDNVEIKALYADGAAFNIKDGKSSTESPSKKPDPNAMPKADSDTTKKKTATPPKSDPASKKQKNDTPASKSENKDAIAQNDSNKYDQGITPGMLSNAASLVKGDANAKT